MIITTKPMPPKPKVHDALWEGSLAFPIQEISVHGFAYIHRKDESNPKGWRFDCIPFSELEPHALDGHWSRKNMG